MSERAFMPIDWGPFVDFIRCHEHFLLTTHIRPDGDGLGSMKALALALKRQGKGVQSVIASTFPARYRFLDQQGTIRRFVANEQASGGRGQGSERDGLRASHLDARSKVEGREPKAETPALTTDPSSLTPPDAVIVLDTGTWNQLGEFAPFLRNLKATRVVVDHHQTQDNLGALCFVDTGAEATGRLTCDAIDALGVPLDEEIANSLFVALAMDTGWFRHSNTSAATFELASRLVKAGARPETLYDFLYEENSLARMKLMGVILSRLQVSCQGLVAHTELRLADYQSTGATPQDSEDLVNYTRSLAGVEVGLFFMEQPRGGVKVSFRSKARVDVARVAERFGGGGHRLASGAIIEAPLEQARQLVLDSVANAIRNLEHQNLGTD
jgi:bifunctional oligoribonuclease and PAP phosphatase NrnA